MLAYCLLGINIQFYPLISVYFVSEGTRHLTVQYASKPVIPQKTKGLGFGEGSSIAFFPHAFHKWSACLVTPYTYRLRSPLSGDVCITVFRTPDRPRGTTQCNSRAEHCLTADTEDLNTNPEFKRLPSRLLAVTAFLPCVYLGFPICTACPVMFISFVKCFKH